MWKRKQAIVGWEWDLDEVDDDNETRPEFAKEVKRSKSRLNPVTGKEEPYVPRWNKVLRLFTVVSLILFMLSIVIGAVFGVIVYQVAMRSILFSKTDGNPVIQRNSKLIASATGGVLNLIIIVVLNYFYKSVALWLTKLEAPRTSTDFEDSYTFKIFLFQFINYYSSLLYIAFFKGRFVSHPGESSSLLYDQCDPAGCLFELCIQLGIIMVGKQAFNNFKEFFIPFLVRLWRRRSWRGSTSGSGSSHSNDEEIPRWEADYLLQAAPKMTLFQEYLEMVIQFGFVTLFVTAFPPAPLFALVNNIIEIRLDASKFTKDFRRSPATRVLDIGAWFGILQFITYASVACNGFVIAYTSDFIPRMVYKYGYSPDNSLRGYINSSLSVFNVADIDDAVAPLNATTCRYRGYREPPGVLDQDGNPFAPTTMYWHIFAARLAFVVIFEHLIFFITGILAYAIPDVPRDVEMEMQREKVEQRLVSFEKAKTFRRISDPRHKTKHQSDAEDSASTHHHSPEPLRNSRRQRSTVDAEAGGSVQMFTSRDINL